MYVAVCPQMDCVRDHRKPNGSLGLSPSPILHGPSLLSEHDRHSSVSCDCLLAQRSRVKCYKVKGLSMESLMQFPLMLQCWQKGMRSDWRGKEDEKCVLGRRIFLNLKESAVGFWCRGR